jgi:subfamily B ATP-binding cassette protein MsbA
MPKSKITFSHVFKTIIWPRKKLLFLGLLLIIISRLAGLVLPGSTKFLMDDVIAKGDLQVLKMLLIVVTIAIIVQSITSFLLTKLLSVEAQHLISVLRARVQKQLLRLPVRYFDNNKSGALVSRVMTDVEGVRNLVGTGLVQLIGGLLTAIVSLVLLLRISPSMTLFTLIPITIFGLISMKAFSTIRPIFRERGKINAEVTGRLTETLNGVRVIKGFNAETQEIKVFEQGVQRIFLNVKKTLTTTSLVTSSATFLLGLASVAIMGMSAYKIVQNEMTQGDFLSFTLYLGFMIAPIVQMSNIGSQLTEAFAGLDRTEEIMNMEPEDDGKIRTINIGAIKGDMRFQNVSFAYEEGKQVLNDISFIAPSGTVTALVGNFRLRQNNYCGFSCYFP